jgi:8-oxo-dGTP pyrophosphatase MutT (NUDIX family)
VLNFDPNRPKTVPRDAATVIVVREAAAGVELFCVERHARSGFLGGAVVFPGGKVDDGDQGPGWSELSTPLCPRALEFAEQKEVAQGFAIAALRELLEEGAILPVVGDVIDGTEALALRDQLAKPQEPGKPSARAFAELLRERGLVADTARLQPLWRWVTPEAEAKRYDTRFYLLPVPKGQVGIHDQHETTSSFWATPEQVLSRWMNGEIFLAPPTVRSIEIFTTARTVEQALLIAGTQNLDPICPAFVLDGEQPILTLPGDPLHPEKLAVPVDPSAPTRFVMENGRFVGRRAAGA